VVRAGNRHSSPGAYGFRLVSGEPDTVLPSLTDVRGDAQVVRVSWRQAAALQSAREIGADRVLLSYRRGGSLLVQREPAEVEFAVPHVMTPEMIVHPMATMPLSVFAHWRGDITLHGGAFVHGDGAWAVCGDRAAGKSTMLALLGERGVPIVADDLIAINAGNVVSGPRCVDLRSDVASRFPRARSLGRVGNRIRYRLDTAPSPERVPLRGIFLLEWGESTETEVAALPTADRIALLHAQRYSTLFGDANAGGVMELLDLPMLRFRRSRRWDRAGEALERLLAVADAQ
jgi:hypothetical protein